jgi:hypothetical protein
MILNLKSNPAYYFAWKNGWFKFNNYIVRWNTTWYTGEYILFLISKLKLAHV